MENMGEKVKSRWTRSFFTALDRKNDEEKYICDICQKDLASPSNLALHRNTHVIERPYKCEPCQVSFVTQGKKKIINLIESNIIELLLLINKNYQIFPLLIFNRSSTETHP